MKQLQHWYRALLALPASLAWAALAFAQEQAPSVDIQTTTTTTSEAWYSNWWVWAAGVAVFLIVVIALTTRGGSNRA